MIIKMESVVLNFERLQDFKYNLFYLCFILKFINHYELLFYIIIKILRILSGVYFRFDIREQHESLRFEYKFRNIFNAKQI